MPYYVIHNSDGDTFVEEVTKEELIEKIEPEDGDDAGYYGPVGFLSKVSERDTNYWGDNILIIKGEIITPEPKEVIKTFDIK